MYTLQGFLCLYCLSERTFGEILMKNQCSSGRVPFIRLDFRTKVAYIYQNISALRSGTDFFILMEKRVLSMDVFVGRQPIFTADKNVFAYELLFRSGEKNAFSDYDGDMATSQVLANTFLSRGKDTILRGKPGFVNFTKNLICDQIPRVFPKDQVFVEVLEDIEPEPEVIDALYSLKKKGYPIVLDDFIYDDKYQPFITVCDIIKFDLIATPLDTIESTIEKILDMGNITLLAEKVESYEEFLQAREKGFTLFQGYFFAKP